MLKKMTDVLALLRRVEEGTMHDAIAELKRTPNGAFIAYTQHGMTPIYLGTPEEEAFHTALEYEQHLTKEYEHTLFARQIELLAVVWKKQLRDALLKHPARYVDARFDGQIIVKSKS